MTTRSGSASYDGFGKDGKGHVCTQSGVLSHVQYGFGSRSKTASAPIPRN